MRDDELTELRARVDCRAVLERAGWTLDQQESTRGAAKYRHGAGRIVIVTHEGRGWFDPVNGSKGDVLALAQLVWGGTLGHARKRLRPLAGLASPVATKQRAAETEPRQGAAIWERVVAIHWQNGTVLRAECAVLGQLGIALEVDGHRAAIAEVFAEKVHGAIEVAPLPISFVLPGPQGQEDAPPTWAKIDDVLAAALDLALDHERVADVAP
jgi:hypothetical protein